MLDIKLIRNNPEILRTALQNRQLDPSILEKLLDLDTKWRTDKKEEEGLRAERNKLSLAISEAKKKSGEVNVKEQKLKKKSGEISARTKELSAEVEQLEKEIKLLMLTIPNIPHVSVPIGKDESGNLEIRKYRNPTRSSANVLSHDILGEKLGLIDFERGTKLAGHRFTVMYSAFAKLERAIANFMLNVHSFRGYTEVWVPHLVKTEIMQGTGQLPKFIEELYKIDDGLWLIPTAEVPLTNLHANEVLELTALPKKYTSLTPCYRREAGNYGKDIKGMIRQHQFDKVELVKFSTQEESFRELEGLVNDAENILQLLELPYRTILLCTGDMGFASAKTYDVEVWIPSQDKYREISSCSNCTDFQARRANMKYRDKNGEMKFVHTLNGSGLAVGRTLIAIIENYQDENGIEIPKVLRDFMGCERIDF